MIKRTSFLVALLAVLLISGGLGAAGARAQTTGASTTTAPPSPGTTKRTTTTTAEPQADPPPPPASSSTTAPPSTSTTAPGDAPDPPGGGGGGGGPLKPPLGGTTTTTSPSGGSGDRTGGGGGEGGGDGDANVPAAERVIPPGYQELINSVRRSRANNTGALLAALRPLEDLGLTPEQAALVGFGRFPVAGYATFIDDWWYPRFTPAFHLHQGTDIFAAAGTPVRAPVDGVMRQSNGAVGGLSVYVTQTDGTYFYMAHLAAYVEGQVSGQRVKTGDVVGFLGDTGNAQGGSPHVHLEIHPRGGGAVDPKPFLDKFLSDAIANVPQLIAAYENGRPRALVTTGLTRRLGEGRSGVFAAPSTPPRSQLLWASSASPSGGALRLAAAEVAEASRSIDWAAISRNEQQQRVRWEEADLAARTLLGPVTPVGLSTFLGLPRRSTGFPGHAVAGPIKANRPT